MDLFPSKTGSAGIFEQHVGAYPAVVTTKGIGMGYYDGNTVTAMWKYAQNFALSDNSYNTQVRTFVAGRCQPDLGPDERNHSATLNGTHRAPKSRTGRAVSRSSAMPTLSVTSVQLGDSKSRFDRNTNVGNLLNTRGTYLGLVPGRVRSDGHQSERDHGLQEEHRVADHRTDRSRLRAAP